MRSSIFLYLFLIPLMGCSLQKLALKSTTGLLSYSIEAIYAEPDLEIAEQAIASNLKLLEGFHRADPQNQTLLLMLTQGFASYSLSFVEDKDPVRASRFYLRGRDYGFQLLQRTQAFRDSIPFKVDNFKQALRRLKKSDVPALFWTAFAWAGWINLNKNDPQAVFDLNKVKAMMWRVLQLDETFFFASAHLFFGSVLGSLPKLLGGDPEKAKEHFDRCMQLTDNKYLMAHVYYARFYAVTTLDEPLFEQMLKTVIDAPQDILPGYELLTSVAKKKARILLDRKEELL